MRVLLDECVPRPLRRALTGHNVRTISELGWAGKKNGELLSLMASETLEVLVTVDQNLRFQQALSSASVSVIVLKAISNRLNDLLPLAPDILAALTTIRPGDVVEITA
jgi:hypothetical protein